MPLERSELVLNCTLSHNGVLLPPGSPIPDDISDAMVEALMKRNEVRKKDDPSSSTILRVEPKQETQEETPAKPERNPARLGPDAALDPAGLQDMDVEELNVIAAEKGWEGEPFTEASTAVNYLSANFSR